MISGSEQGAKQQQLRELKRLPATDAQNLLKEAGVNYEINSRMALSFKSSQNISWTQLRSYRRWFTDWGVKLSSEKEMRKLDTTDQVGIDIKAELAPFTFPIQNGRTVRMAPLVCTSDLASHIYVQLNTLQRENQLTWFAGGIPKEEIWVKLGGDKGGGSTKFTFQILNVNHPNSSINTTVFAAFIAPDTAINISTALIPYRNQLEDLEHNKWMNKALKLFLSGDCEFLCHMYGLSGASGFHCCLWCLIPKHALKKPRHERGLYPKRTLETLKEHHQKFKDLGSNLKKAKECYNVIGEAIFDIPINRVSPPSLHIDLGIFLKLYNLFEEHNDELDVELLFEKSMTDEPLMFEAENKEECLEKVKKYRELKSKAESLKETAESMYDDISTLLLSGCSLAQEFYKMAMEKADEMANRAETMENEAESIKPVTLGKSGPCTSNLDNVLKELHVERKAYHGKAFVGNQVHKCLKTSSIKRLVSSPVEVIEHLCPNNSKLKEKSLEIKNNFSKIFTLFAKCNQIYSKAATVTSEECTQLETNVDEFLRVFRETFPSASITPKMHFLEDHVCRFIREHKFGLGFMGEQGEEAVHNEFNQIERMYSNIHVKLDRLKAMVHEHLRRTHPSNRINIPLAKRRKHSA